MALAENSRIPEGAQLGIRAFVWGDNEPDRSICLYAVNEISNDGREENLFLFRSDKTGNHAALILAPRIDSLSQRISQGCEYVEYYDKAGKTIIRADGYLEENQLVVNILSSAGYKLEESGAVEIPRYFYEDIDASFFLMETLTAPQILKIQDIFQVYNKYDQLSPLVEYIHGREKRYIFSDEIYGKYAGLAVGHSEGVLIIYPATYDTMRSFNYMVGVLAHEGLGHYQTANQCEGMTAGAKPWEIGDMTIPEGFFNWSAEELIENYLNSGYPCGTLGAYHVSLWVETMLWRITGDKYFRYWAGWHQYAIYHGQFEDGSPIP